MERREVEMQKRLHELQAESEIAELKSKKTFEKHQLRLQIEEAEGSIRASSICPSLMSLTLEEDKNSDIKSWLDQSVEDFNTCFSQPKESSREIENKCESSKPSQKFQSIYNQKNLQSRVQSRGLSKSPQRKEAVFSQSKSSMLPQQIMQDSKPKFQFSKPTFKAENDFPSFTPAVSVQQPVHFVQTSLPKLKLSEFHGDPLEWPEWSSLFTATIHNAPIDDKAKMSHLKTLVKGRAKAAIAGLGYSGVMYSAAWNALVTNFGRPQTIVNTQMKQIHLSPFIKSHDSAAIIKYAQLITTCVNVLKQFGFTGDLYSESVLNSALRKLPPELKTKWFFLAKSKGYYHADLCKFSEWLNEVAYVHDEMTVQFKSQPEKKGYSNTEKVKTSTFAANEQNKSTSASTKQCPLRDGDHKIWMCMEFKQQGVNERYETLEKYKLCFCCLNSHLMKDCKSDRVCGVNGCTKKHNKLLHSDSSKTEKDKTSEEPSSQNRAGGSSMLSTGSSGFLQLIPISIGNDKRSVETLALCDTGSTVSFMDKTLVDLLKLKGKESVMSVAGIHGLSEMKTEIVTARIGPSETDTAGEKITFCSHPNLNVGDKIYDFTKMKENYVYLNNLPDIKVSMADVKVILGQDAYHLIRPLEYKSGGRDEPWAVKTSLGWTVSGALPKKERKCMAASCNFSVSSDPLADQMKKWWDMETYASVCDVSGRSKEEKRAQAILEKTTKHNGERYEVGLLWADDNPNLPNNYYSAYQQFLSMERRLSKNPGLKEAYKATIEKDLENHFVQKLEQEEVVSTENDMQWYLPHHPVKHPHKPGKVRRVCNAASKFKGVSLNDKLLSGPDLLRNLVGIVFRFREHLIAITADIESMFSQVAVPKEECRVLRFLWRDKPDDNIEIFEYTRHVFGAKSSPTCANYGFQQCGRENKSEFPVAVVTIDRNFYMDDLVKSVDTTQEAIECYQQLMETLKRSGSTLKKWARDCSEVLQRIPVEDRSEANEFTLNAESFPILGLEWIIDKDCLQVCRGPSKECPQDITQRVVLSFVSSVFDPMGIFAPFTMRMRILLKSIWIRFGQSWDEKIADDDKQVFLEWMTEMQTIKNTSLPRNYFPDSPKNIKLHIFSDASLEAMCIVAYFRAEVNDGVEVSFV